MTKPSHTSARQAAIKGPKPETLRPILISVAFENPRPAQHRYVETVPCEFQSPHVEDADKSKDRRAWGFVLECLETGFRRRWGIVERTVDVPLEAYPIDESVWNDADADKGGN
jgi:hypothetical protein